MKLFKPKFWDKQKDIYSIILYPFSFIFKILSFIKKKIILTKEFKIPVICVGNIYLGGTGKTPLAILLHDELKKIKKPVIIRKHYKNHKDEYDLIISNKGSLIVDNKRTNAISQAESRGFNLAILDDGFQDFSIKKNLNVICFNSKQPLGNGLVIPAGPLREEISSLERAQIIVINGVRNKSFEEKLIEKKNNLKIFYSKYNPKNVDEFRGKNLLAFAGIGNPDNFFNLLLRNNLNIKRKIYFPDHYKYKKHELDKIISEAKKEELKIITTEKDFERLKNFNLNEIKHLQVELMIENKEEFINEILRYF